MTPGNANSIPLGVTGNMKFKPLEEVVTHGRANCTDCGCDIQYIMGMFMCVPCAVAYKDKCTADRKK